MWFLIEIGGQTVFHHSPFLPWSWDITLADTISCKILSGFLLESCSNLQATYVPRNCLAVRRL